MLIVLNGACRAGWMSVVSGQQGLPGWGRGGWGGGSLGNGGSRAGPKAGTVVEGLVTL